MGSESNLINISFDYDGLRPLFVEGNVQDRNLNAQLPVQTFASTRVPLVSQPAWLTQPHARKKAFRDSGQNTMQAFARAQAETDRAQDSVVRGTGELDALRYEAILKPARIGRRARRRLQLRWTLLRAAGKPYAGARQLPAALHTWSAKAWGDQPGGGSMTRFFGKYRGQVTNNIDPLQIGRVQVSVPAVLGDGSLSWAMPCTPSGQQRFRCLRRAADRQQCVGRI